ncbi:MAG TPA: glycoside hydrolase family 19 protein [Candidatus Dormibacteraeota bacterium]|nr:glycoside hydrolase family 19 protein [Candidatus Dormibacteraeota bacterium]
MRLTRAILTELGVTAARADRYLPDLQALLPQHGIDTPLRVAHFLAQVLHESGLLRIVEENLNYSAEGLRRVFPRYFTAAQAERYARQPPAIANRVYGGRLGNGDEASGDGFRYRGRGLIQLTGKANYRAFADWLGSDVVAAPERVAGECAVHGAVFYWTLRSINEPADADDVREVTRRINGGFIGLPERIRLLDAAKRALAHETPGSVVAGATHVVIATQLNLRNAPRVAPSTRIATLAQGTAVAMLGDAGDGWARVRVVLGAQAVDGFVSAGFLRAAAAPPAAPPRAAVEIPRAHLQEGRRDVTRRRDGGRAFPLGEAGMPRRSSADPQRRAAQLLDIVAWLDSENRVHLRYGPRSSVTFCNVYAYDYCYLADAYLPRVFWTAPALARIGAGEAVPVRYDNTVGELNANALHDWLRDFGPGFGWRWVADLDVLQAAANAGQVCLIVAKRKDQNRSGHIVAVVPEDRVRAARAAGSSVLRPVESQASVTNHRFVVKPTAWWRGAQFQSFAFWRHE